MPVEPPPMPTPPRDVQPGIVHGRPYQLAVLWLLGTGVALLMAGSVVAGVDRADTGRFGTWAAALGLALLASSTAMAHPLQTLRQVGLKTTGGAHYDRLKRWTRLKVASILLNLLSLAAATALLVALLARADAVDLDLGLRSIARATHALTLLVSLTLAFAFYLSLRTPIERETVGTTTAFFQLGAAATLVFAAAAAWLAGLRTIPGPVDFRQADAPFFLLAAATSASFAVFASRALPTVYALFTEERSYYKGRTYLSRTKSVVAPTMVAFALLFVVVLVVIVFQIGLVGLVQEIPRNAVLLAVFGLIVLALVVSVGVSVLLSRSEDRLSLFRRRRSEEKRKEIAILTLSAALTTLLLAVAAILFVRGAFPGVALADRQWLDFLAFALLTSLGPYGFYVAGRRKRIRKLEERFPDFLRDLAASRKAGITLDAAVRIAAKGEYGALTPEIQKMADQLSWNVPFEDALVRFMQRVRTPLIERAVTLIVEASRTGGHVTDVLLAAANDAREIKNLETERRTTMSLYTIIVYITFLVFLVVAAVLYASFVPPALEASQAAIASGAAGFGGISFGALSRDDYRTFYFMASLVQAVGNGFVAGLMESGRGTDGLRHGFVMVLVTYLTFTVALS